MDCEQLKKTLFESSYAFDSVSFLKNHLYLLEPHLVRFYRDNTWEIIPEEWQVYFDSCDENTVTEKLDSIADDLPESLVEFCKGCKYYKVNRSIVERTKQNSVGIPKALKQMKGMKMKKQHEISLMAGEINNLCNSLDIDTVIDVGAGSAYLSHLLYLQCSIKSIGIEGNPSHSESAIQRVKQLEQRIKVHNSKESNIKIPLPNIDLVTCRFDYQHENIQENFEVF